jgi:hypothetical protein
VRRSLSPQDEVPYYPPTESKEIIDWHGYYWWTWSPEWYLGYRALQARRFAGRQVLVLPELNLILATTADIDGVSSAVADGQEAEIYAFIKEWVLHAVLDADLEE